MIANVAAVSSSAPSENGFVTNVATEIGQQRLHGMCMLRAATMPQTAFSTSGVVAGVSADRGVTYACEIVSPVVQYQVLNDQHKRVEKGNLSTCIQPVRNLYPELQVLITFHFAFLKLRRLHKVIRYLSNRLPWIAQPQGVHKLTHVL